MNTRVRLLALVGLLAGFLLVVIGVGLTLDAGYAVLVAGVLLLVAAVDMIR